MHVRMLRRVYVDARTVVMSHAKRARYGVFSRHMHGKIMDGSFTHIHTYIHAIQTYMIAAQCKTQKRNQAAISGLHEQSHSYLTYMYRISLCVYRYMCFFALHVCVCICMFMHAHTYIHTYIHTRT
jgi:hypothetical protein